MSSVYYPPRGSGGSVYWGDAVSTVGSLPAAGAVVGEVRLVLADDNLYEWNGSSWQKITDSGSVVGPASSTDNAVARFDGTTGKLVQNSLVIIGDTGNVTGIADLTATGTTTLSTSLTGPARLTAGVVGTGQLNLATEATGILATTMGGTGVNGTAIYPISGTIATTAYVDSVAQGLSPKAAVVVATTANITLSGEQTIDGVLTSASRVLVKNQSAPAQNGIYVSAAGAWTRSLDMDTWAEVPSAYCFVDQGTTQESTGWVCTSNAGGTIGVTAIVFTQFSGAGTYTAGSGLLLTGNVFSASNITDTNISASAAIARSKLAVGTANHVVINSGTGAFSSVAQLAVSMGGTNSGSALNNGRVMVSLGSAIVESPVFFAASSGTLVQVTAGIATDVNLLLKGFTAQSGNFLQLQDVSANVKGFFDATGGLAVGGSTLSTTNSGVDIWSGGIGLLIGADNSAQTRTNTTTKVARVASKHYTNAQAPAAIFVCSNSSTTSSLDFGGSSGSMSAVTSINFWTAANNTTTTGTQRMTVISSGNVGIGETTPTAALSVVPNATGTTNLILQNFASQTAPALEVKSSAPATLARIDVLGKFWAGDSDIGSGNPTNAHFAFQNDPTTGFYRRTTGVIGWQASGGQKMFFTSAGNLLLSTDNQTVTTSTINGQSNKIQFTGQMYSSALQGTDLAYVGWYFRGGDTAGDKNAIRFLGNSNTYQTAINNICKTSGIAGHLTFETSAAASVLVERLRLDSNGFVGINQTTPTAMLQVTQLVATTGSPTAYLVTGAAHTTLTASTEAIDINLNLARTVQFATGAITTQRASVVQAPTYGFVGASTITTAATFAITGAPVAGTNATITNAYSLWVQAGTVRFAGALTVDGAVTFNDGTNIMAATSVVAVSSNVTLTNKALHYVNTSSARSLTLPAPSAGAFMVVKDSTGSCATNNITIVRAASEQIETVAASYVLNTDLGSWTFTSDGTNWFII